MEPGLQQTGDACEYVGEPGQGIDAVEFRRRDQRHYKRGPIGAAFGAGEEP